MVVYCSRETGMHYCEQWKVILDRTKNLGENCLQMIERAAPVAGAAVAERID
jgi:hypothetical protein